MTQTLPDTPLAAQDDAALRTLLTTILASVPDAMIVIDQKGAILAFSAEAEALFGYASEDVAGQNVSMLMTHKDRDHHDQYMANYLSTGIKQIIGIGRVVEAKLANGDAIPVELKIGEARIGDQRLFTGYIRDMTAQQAAEHRIRQMQSEIGNFSRLSAVGTMAAAMAHELNQPLTAVSNYLEAARDLLDSPDKETVAVVQDALDAAASQSIRAGQIIRRLRDYVSRGEIETTPTDLAPLIEDAASLAKIGVTGKVPRINTAIPDNLPRVHAEAAQIRQVLINLIKNAFEAMEATSNPQVWVTASIDENDTVCVNVRDNGPGFSEIESVETFQPFQTSKPTGMGLGLSICQTIIEGHGGRIWAETAPEGGALFRFTLQAARIEDTKQ